MPYKQLKTYKGKFLPKNPEKYKGDVSNIIFRSLWEYSLMKWLDQNSAVLEWQSEETVIPYICATDKKPHRYFVDFKIKFESGRIYLIELKPKKETLPPPKPKRVTRRYIEEVFKYGKNHSKWKAAKEYAEDRGWVFSVWTEDVLEKLGIKIFKPLRKTSK